MPPHKPKIGIGSLYGDQMMEKVIGECARKIERIDSYSCDCLRKR